MAQMKLSEQVEEFLKLQRRFETEDHTDDLLDAYYSALKKLTFRLCCTWFEDSSSNDVFYELFDPDL